MLKSVRLKHFLSCVCFTISIIFIYKIIIENVSRILFERRLRALQMTSLCDKYYTPGWKYCKCIYCMYILHENIAILPFIYHSWLRDDAVQQPSESSLHCTRAIQLLCCSRDVQLLCCTTVMLMSRWQNCTAFSNVHTRCTLH